VIGVASLILNFYDRFLPLVWGRQLKGGSCNE